jgi:hypothetical protein
VETHDMATYKKKPGSLTRISSSWTRVVSCSFRMSAKRGLLLAARQYSATATAVTKFRPSGVLPYPLAAAVLVCMSVFMPIILLAGKSSLSCAICCVICAGILFCSGIEGPSTGDLM